MSNQNEIQIIHDAISILSRTKECSDRYQADIIRLKDRERYLKDNTYRLGLVGITSSGKSTLINALLGQQVLPADANPTTNVIVCCRHGKSANAKVYYQDGGVEDISSADLVEELGILCSETFNPHNEMLVKEIDIEFPDFEFPEDVVLIDSPGLDAYGHKEHEKLTLESLLPTLDICIYVLSSKDFDEKKLKDVLNTAAYYGKEVIVVQNMIDAVKDSADHKKSREEILNEYYERIRRVIAETDCNDKSGICIVQMSALNALLGRSKKKGHLLDASGYADLKTSVLGDLNIVKPRIQAHRLMSLQSIFRQIAIEAGKDAGGNIIIVEDFQFSDIMPNFKAAKSQFDEVLNSKKSALEELQKKMPDGITKFEFDEDKKIINNSASKIKDGLRKFNDTLKGIAQRLNIDEKELYLGFSFYSANPSYETKKVYERRKFFLARWLLGEKESIVGDDRLNKSSLIKDINSLTGLIDKIQGSLKSTEHRISKEVDSLFTSYNARKNLALSAKAYAQIKTDLERLADGIEIPETALSDIESQRIKSGVLKPVAVSKVALSLINLAKLKIEIIHKEIISHLAASDHKNIIVGWDHNCEADIAYRYFAAGVDDSCINTGINKLTDNILILNSPDQTSVKDLPRGAKNYFFLVNTTQIGSTRSRLQPLNLASWVNDRDSVFFVIEDSEEAINADSLDESVRTVMSLSEWLVPELESTVLFNLSNPIYNLVAAEVQVYYKRRLLETDETRIFNDLGSLFPALKFSASEITIKNIIKSLTQNGKQEFSNS